ncbi:hypothetical protein FRAHR75_430065 [Frankia sp. Hr75.2]|nr:hypothetical protein FRAHR75_430065 [Frankia sp. Hr75.2]
MLAWWREEGGQAIIFACAVFVCWFWRLLVKINKGMKGGQHC